MKALLLAAGLGTRLRPVTNSVPKCLVPIGGKPLLQIWLERLTAAGHGPFLINTHYLAEQVKDFCEQSPLRHLIELSHEKDLRGTAGTLLENLDFFKGEDGMLIHADNYCLADLRAFSQAHADRPPRCEMTMMAFDTDTPSTCGILETDVDGVVTAFHEKVATPPGRLANGAIYIISAGMMRELAMSDPSPGDFSTEVVPNYMNRIYVYKTQAPFLDIGTVQMLEKAQDIARNKKDET